LPQKGQNKGDTKMNNEKIENQRKDEEEKVAEEMFKKVRLYMG
jgi:hypothetical protein